MMAFDGFRFGDDRPYTDDEGKRVLLSATTDLRARDDLRRELRIDRDSGKSKITKGQTSVWDAIKFQDAPSDKAFNRFPHLTLGVNSEAVSAYVTLPNGAPARMRESLLDGDIRKVVGAVLERMRPEMDLCAGMKPRLQLRHRKWPKGIGGVCVYIAHHDFDLRSLKGDPGAGIESRPYGITAVSIALRKKKKSKANLELRIGASFPYRTCPAMREPGALDHLVAAWIACKPFIRQLRVATL